MTSSPYNLVDSAGQFVANIVSKNGRNEIQIYHFAASSTSSGPIVDETRTRRFELGEAITCATWFNNRDAVKSLRKLNKRKADSDSSAMENVETQPSTLLAVAFASGEICIYSPFADAAVGTIQAPALVISLTHSSTENCVWALTDSRNIIEVNTSSGTVNRTIKFLKTDKDAHTIRISPFKPKKAGRRGAETELIIVASSRLYLVDGAKSRNSVVAELADGDDDEKPAPINHVLLLLSDDLSFFTTRANSNTVSLYDLEDPTQKPSTYDCRSRRITGLRSLTDSLVAVFTDAGTEILSVKEDVLDGCVGTIRTNSKHVAFADMIVHEVHGVVGIWYDGIEPRFAHVANEPSFDGDMKINVSYQPLTEDKTEEDVPDITFVAEDELAEESEDYKNIPATDLVSLLRDLLTVSKPPRKEVLTLCCKNKHEETIKDTMRLFSRCEQCALIIANLFQIVIREVSKDPTRRSPLAVWLKWILLAHGGYISKQQEQEENLRALKESLTQGMTMMPKLLALQGRLQLLKSQADLRNKTNRLELDDEDELDVLTGLDAEIGNDTTNNTTMFEDSVMYANGENDDLEGETTHNGTVIYENGEAGAVDDDAEDGVETAA